MIVLQTEILFWLLMIQMGKALKNMGKKGRGGLLTTSIFSFAFNFVQHQKIKIIFWSIWIINIASIGKIKIDCQQPRLWITVNLIRNWLAGWLFPFIYCRCRFPIRETAPEDGKLLWGIVLGYKTKLLRALPGSLACPAYIIVTWDLGFTSCPKEH